MLPVSEGLLSLWNGCLEIEKPILSPLIDAAEKVYRENQKFRKAAREQAESHFSIDKIIEEYLSFLFDHKKNQSHFDETT